MMMMMMTLMPSFRTDLQTTSMIRPNRHSYRHSILKLAPIQWIQTWMAQIETVFNENQEPSQLENSTNLLKGATSTHSIVRSMLLIDIPWIDHRDWIPIIDLKFRSVRMIKSCPPTTLPKYEINSTSNSDTILTVIILPIETTLNINTNTHFPVATPITQSITTPVIQTPPHRSINLLMVAPPTPHDKNGSVHPVTITSRMMIGTLEREFRSHRHGHASIIGINSTTLCVYPTQLAPFYWINLIWIISHTMGEEKKTLFGILFKAKKMSHLLFPCPNSAMETFVLVSGLFSQVDRVWSPMSSGMVFCVFLWVLELLTTTNNPIEVDYTKTESTSAY